MSVGPLPILPIVEQVRAQVAALRSVQGAAEFAAATKSTSIVTPSGYVLLAKERAAPVTAGSAIRVQQIDAEFSVVLAVRNWQVSQLGAAQSEELTQLITALRLGFSGWRHPSFPEAEVRRAEIVSGELLAYDHATVWWQEIFRITYWSRS